MSMVFSAAFEGLVCTVKDTYSPQVICSGRVMSVSDKSVIITDIVEFDDKRPSSVIITITNPSHGLYVFSANVKRYDTNEIEVIDLMKIADSERRSVFRADAGFPASVIDRDQHVADAMIMDISIKGMALWLHSPLKLGGVYYVAFSVNGVYCTCEVNIIREIGLNKYSQKKYGCDYNQITDAVRNIIAQYVNKRRTELMLENISNNILGKSVTDIDNL